MALVDLEFTRSLPKVELHAHLTGSITARTLHEIWQYRSTDTSSTSLLLATDVEDPLLVLSSDRNWDVRTFFPLFSSYVYRLVSDSASIVYSTNAVLEDFADDGVVYLELRTTPRASQTLSKEAYVETVLGSITKSPTRARMSTFLILSVDRRNTYHEAMETVDLAIKYQDQGAVGVDLCGDPSKGDLYIFTPALAKAKEAGLRLTIHFAEVPASSSQAELETLLSFQPDRLGHVIYVPDSIKAEIVRRKIAIELCISCNVQAKLTEGGIQDHHFGWWKSAPNPLVLCVSVHP